MEKKLLNKKVFFLAFGVVVGLIIASSPINYNISTTSTASVTYSQNVFETIYSESGSLTADNNNDSINISGGTDIDTSIIGDKLWVNYTGSGGSGSGSGNIFDQDLNTTDTVTFFSIAGDGGNLTNVTATANMDLSGNDTDDLTEGATNFYCTLSRIQSLLDSNWIDVNNLTVNGESVTDTLIGQWNTAYGWGDHSSQGYLTSQKWFDQDLNTSDNPTFDDITLSSYPNLDKDSTDDVTNDTSNWDEAYGWGDWSVEDFSDITDDMKANWNNTQDLNDCKIIVSAIDSFNGSTADYICDGVNDQVEINQAIEYVNDNGGGQIYLLSGTYNITDSIYLYNNTNIYGCGIGNTFIHGNMNKSFFKNKVHNWRIEDLEIGRLYLYTDDKDVYTGSIGLNLENVTNANINDIIIKNCNISVNVSGTSYYNMFTNVQAKQAYYGFKFTKNTIPPLNNPPNDNKLLNCRTNHAQFGIWTYGTTMLNVISASIENGEIGIKSIDSDSTHVIGCRIETFVTGIELDSNTRYFFSFANHFSNNNDNILDSGVDTLNFMGNNNFIGSLNVFDSDAGTNPPSSAIFTIEENDNTGMAICTPNNKYGYIFFTDPNDNDVGAIRYEHSTNELEFRASGGYSMVINASGIYPRAGKTYYSNDGSEGWTGSFTNGDGATVTVKNGLITDVS